MNERQCPVVDDLPNVERVTMDVYTTHNGGDQQNLRS
jgi:hypothetical protein